MVRINVYIDKVHREYLKSLPGGLSENVRIAIREYVIKLESSRVSPSASKRGGGKDE